MLATSGASGGYAVLKVFGQNFPRIVRDALSGNRALESIAADVISRASIAYLPNLVWAFREAKAGNFDQSESVTATLGPELGRTLPYRLLIRPMADASPAWRKGCSSCRTSPRESCRAWTCCAHASAADCTPYERPAVRTRTGAAPLARRGP